MIRNIIIYGKSDFAKLMYHYLKNDTSYNVVAFCVDKEYFDENIYCNLPVIIFEDINKLYPSSSHKVLVAVGYSNMRARKIMFEKVKSKKYKCINYISSKAIIDESVSLGENNIILQNTVIEPFVQIGDNNIIWSSSNICHNVIIESHCFIAAQSVVGGFSIVKNNVFLGFNATILQNIVLEDETLVGAKALILKNTDKYIKYLGNPAKKISSHEEEGIRIK